MAFTVDGFEWDIPCTIERTAEVQASEISGMLLDKTYFNDVLGTFMRYTVSIAIPKGWENEYSQIYEILTQPSESHSFTLPYNQTTIDLTARVETVSDSWVRLPRNKQTWRKTTFEIIANHPTKQMSLAQVISAGMKTPPENVDAEEGLYQYTSVGWVRVDMPEYTNADEVYY